MHGFQDITNENWKQIGYFLTCSDATTARQATSALRKHEVHLGPVHTNAFLLENAYRPFMIRRSKTELFIDKNRLVFENALQSGDFSERRALVLVWMAIMGLTKNALVEGGGLSLWR